MNGRALLMKLKDNLQDTASNCKTYSKRKTWTELAHQRSSGNRSKSSNAKAGAREPAQEVAQPGAQGATSAHFVDRRNLLALRLPVIRNCDNKSIGAHQGGQEAVARQSGRRKEPPSFNSTASYYHRFSKKYRNWYEGGRQAQASWLAYSSPS